MLSVVVACIAQLVWITFVFCSPDVLDCKATFKNTTFLLVEPLIMSNFYFADICKITILIPDQSYLLMNYSTYAYMSTMTYYSSISETVEIKGNVDNEVAILAPPYVEIYFAHESNSYAKFHYKHFKITRHDFDLFNNTRILATKPMQSTDTLFRYFQLEVLSPGTAYIYTPDYLLRGSEYGANTMLNIRTPYCSNKADKSNRSIPIFRNVLLYNGTYENAKPVGTVARISYLNECDFGLDVLGFTLYVVAATPSDTVADFSKMIIIEKPRIEGLGLFYVKFLYWKYPNLTLDYEAYNVMTSYESDVITLVVYSYLEAPDNYEELIFFGLHYNSPPDFPDIDVYSAWPNSSDSSLLAKYSREACRSDSLQLAINPSNLPQKFGGNVRTFLIWKDKTLDDPGSYNLLFVNPNGKRDGVDSSLWNRNYEPFSGRTGFIRSFWLDETIYIDNDILELQETENRTLFDFTFKFAGCQEWAYLTVTTKFNGTERNVTCNCTDCKSMTITSSSILAVLSGEGIVNYTITSSKSQA